MRTSEFTVSRSTIGRVWASDFSPKTWLTHVPPAVRTSSMLRGLDEVDLLVFVAANTRPLASAFRLMWSSAMPVPDSATSVVQAVSVGSASACNAKSIVSFAWLLHITPTLVPNATTDEMSSLASAATAREKGAPQLESLHAGLHTVRFTHTWFPCVQVAQSWPVESLAMARVSVR